MQSLAAAAAVVLLSLVGYRIGAAPKYEQTLTMEVAFSQSLYFNVLKPADAIRGGTVPPENRPEAIRGTQRLSRFPAGKESEGERGLPE